MENLVPQARPGFGSLSTSAPVLMQLNPDGQWSSSKPDDMDEGQLKTIVNYLATKFGSTGTVCSQCARQNSGMAGTANHVPVILMPIQSADDCPFDIEGIVKNKMVLKKKMKKTDATAKEPKDAAKTSVKVPECKIHRLTNFDLLSQW